MEIKTGKTQSESGAPAVVVPPDKGRPARKKTVQNLRRGGSLGSRLLNLLRVVASLSLIALAVLGGFALYRYMYTAEILKLRNIRIEGCKNSDPTSIEALIRQKYPVNILQIDLKQLRSRLEREPWIRRVAIRRILPSGLKIEIEERIPSVIAEIGGVLQLLDKEGILLDAYNPSHGKIDVPVFLGFSGGDVAAYRVMQDENSPRARAGIQVLSELSGGQQDYTRTISEIDLSDIRNVKVLLVNETAEVYLGDHDFLKRFQMFMSNRSKYEEMISEGAEIAAIDLRFESQIIYRLKNAAAEQAAVKDTASRN